MIQKSSGQKNIEAMLLILTLLLSKMRKCGVIIFKLKKNRRDRLAQICLLLVMGLLSAVSSPPGDVIFVYDGVHN